MIVRQKQKLYETHHTKQIAKVPSKETRFGESEDERKKRGGGQPGSG